MEKSVIEVDYNKNSYRKYSICKFLDNGEVIKLSSNSLKELMDEGKKRWETFAIVGEDKKIEKLFKRLDTIENGKADIVCPYCGWIEQESVDWNNDNQYICKKCSKTSNLDTQIIYNTTIKE